MARNTATADTLSDVLAHVEAQDPSLLEGFDGSSAAARAGEQVRAMRHAAGLTQKTLGEKAGFSASEISDIERGRGKHGPSYAALEALAHACGRRLDMSQPRAATPAPEPDIPASFYQLFEAATRGDQPMVQTLGPAFGKIVETMAQPMLLRVLSGHVTVSVQHAGGGEEREELGEADKLAVEAGDSLSVESDTPTLVSYTQR